MIQPMLNATEIRQIHEERIAPYVNKAQRATTPERNTTAPRKATPTLLKQALNYIGIA